MKTVSAIAAYMSSTVLITYTLLSIIDLYHVNH